MVEYDPYVYQVHEDPYPVYRALRDEAPVYRNQAQGFWALSRHADVLAAFKDVETFSSRHGVSLDQDVFHPDADATMSFLAMDPPRHTRMRALVSRPPATSRRAMGLPMLPSPTKPTRSAMATSSRSAQATTIYIGPVL